MFCKKMYNSKTDSKLNVVYIFGSRDFKMVYKNKGTFFRNREL